MKKIVFQLVLLFAFTTNIIAQSVAINIDGSALNTSAILDIKSITKGLLIPRMTTVQRIAIATPAKGLIVFDISTNGLWFYNGTGWNALSSGSSGNYWSAGGSDIYSNTSGNVGIGTDTPLIKLSVRTGTGNYGIIHTDGAITLGTYIGSGEGWLGTKSNHPLSFFANNSYQLMTLLPSGNVGIGTTAPNEKLTVQTLNNSYGIAHRGEGGNILSTRIGGTSAGIGTFSNTNMRIFCNSLSALFIAAATGDVGIGVADNPAYKLDVGDRMRIRSGSASSTAGLWLNNPANTAAIAFMGVRDVDVAGIYGNNAGWGLQMNTNTGAVSVGNQYPVAGYKLSVQGNQYINGLIATTGDAEIGGNTQVSGNINIGGKIGIGGTAYVPLEIYPSTIFPLYYDDGWTIIDNGSQSTNVCIRANGGVTAEFYNAYSDARVKNIAGISNSAKDLETINALQITDYTMKDKVMYGHKAFKKVIAQEVEKVYQQVISTNKGYIPNVYAMASSIEKTANGYLINFTDKHNLSKTAKKLQVMAGRTTSQVDIIAVPSDTQVEIKADNLQTEKVFVYGEEVEDFKSVDYEGLTTLNISATQELSKLIKKQQAIIETQQQQINELLKRLQ